MSSRCTWPADTVLHTACKRNYSACVHEHCYVYALPLNHISKLVIVAEAQHMLQVTDGTRVIGVSNGVQMLTLITAAGCSVTALIAAFVAAAPHDPLVATAHALAVFG